MSELPLVEPAREPLSSIRSTRESLRATVAAWPDDVRGRAAWPSATLTAAPAARLSYAPPLSDMPPLIDVSATAVALAASEPPSVLAPLALEEDDLSVLPGRRRSTSASRRAKVALGLLLGLILFGVVLVMRIDAGPAGDLQADATNAAPRENGVLLPPPPSSDSPAAEPLASEPVRTPRRASNDRAEPEGLLDPRDPRFSRGGPNVRRYADVASPTLSRLAREQQRLARERDDAARKAKAVKR